MRHPQPISGKVRCSHGSLFPVHVSSCRHRFKTRAAKLQQQRQEYNPASCASGIRTLSPKQRLDYVAGLALGMRPDMALFNAHNKHNVNSHLVAFLPGPAAQDGCYMCKLLHFLTVNPGMVMPVARVASLWAIASTTTATPATGACAFAVRSQRSSHRVAAAASAAAAAAASSASSSGWQQREQSERLARQLVAAMVELVESMARHTVREARQCLLACEELLQDQQQAEAGQPEAAAAKARHQMQLLKASSKQTLDSTQAVDMTESGPGTSATTQQASVPAAAGTVAWQPQGTGAGAGAGGGAAAAMAGPAVGAAAPEPETDRLAFAPLICSDLTLSVPAAVGSPWAAAAAAASPSTSLVVPGSPTILLPPDLDSVEHLQQPPRPQSPSSASFSSVYSVEAPACGYPADPDLLDLPLELPDAAGVGAPAMVVVATAGRRCSAVAHANIRARRRSSASARRSSSRAAGYDSDSELLPGEETWAYPSKPELHAALQHPLPDTMDLIQELDSIFVL